MSHDACRQRVIQARARLASQLDSTRQQTENLQETVRQSTSPMRILTAGILGGFTAGILKAGQLPHGTLPNARTLGNLLSILNTVLPAWQQLRAPQASPTPAPATPTTRGEQPPAAH